MLLLRLAAIALAPLLLALPAAAQDGSGEDSPPQREPMIIGAATNFSQGSWTDLMDAARQLPLLHYRDGIRWNEIERQMGRYRFENRRARYPAEVAGRGADLVMTFNWGNPLYDQGHTPHSPEALAAMGRFAAAVVKRYPEITAVEVGNEVNGVNFVNGPVREAGLPKRPEYHLAMVRAIATAVREVRPDIRIYGASTHSIAGGYVWDVLEAGGGQLLDGIAIHPYTTPIDQLAAQIGVLRRHPLARDMPIVVTEFGSQDETRAPDDLIRGYSMLAQLGVAQFYWYPLIPRGDGLIPLLERDGRITETGEAFRFAQSRLATRVAQDISPDPFTFAHQFGDDTLVIWGEPRLLAMTTKGISVHRANGSVIAADTHALLPDRVLVLTADRPIALGQDITLGCSPLVADTFYEFGFGEGVEGPDDRSLGDGAPGPARGFIPSTYRGDEQIGWQVLPGQHRGGVPWNPYLAPRGNGVLRLSEDGMLIPGGWTIAHDYVATHDGEMQLEARIGSGNARFNERIDISLSVNGEPVPKTQMEAGFDALVTLSAGARLRISVSAKGGGRPVPVAYRYRLSDQNRCTP